MSVNVDHNRCPQDHACPAVKLCKFDALSQKGHQAPEVDEDKCTECGLCARFCPRGALRTTGRDQARKVA